MQVAAHPYPPTPYHAAYYPPPPDPQDLQLKRQYLALLPPQQIIEICLTFDVHVSPYIKSTVWPLDINAAIVNLQKHSTLTEGNSSKPQNDGKAIMDSLQSPPAKEPTPPGTDPQPPDKGEQIIIHENGQSYVGPDSSATTSSVTTPAPQIDPALTAVITSPEVPQGDNPPVGEATVVGNPKHPAESPAPTGTPSTSAAPVTSGTSQPAPNPQAPPPAAAPVAPAPYPQQPYLYSHPQAAYPHTPYYAPPTGYSYPYSSYPPGYGHPPVPPHGYPPQTSAYGNSYPMPHPGPAPDMPADDLPSYEDMIVEALTENPDPEGCAPKDMFTWMASRYPLQSNFRPSASQALQKAFKRGRFEKGSNGKYRLSATWEGGSTSRRTTRRPQVQTPSNPPAASSSSSPFTHAPLIHHHNNGNSSQRGQPYPSQPYGYSYPHSGYPGYPAPPSAPAVPQPSTSTSQNLNATATTTKPPNAADPDHADTYEAAKAILNAINSGTLLQLPPEEPKGALDKDHPPQQPHSPPPMVGNGVEQLLSHLHSALANVAVVETVPVMGSTIPRASQSEPRAELQAQLALLAAQLADLAKGDEQVQVILPEARPVPFTLPPPLVTAATDEVHAHPPPPAPVPVSASPIFEPPPPSESLPPPVTPAPVQPPIEPPIPPPPVLAQPEEEEESEGDGEGEEEEEDSDDDDMEEII